ncbi:chorion class B protein PC401-like [Plodia interpunctella]|uniref:chorion class B protein PC401-like n=1 Tax=Plodia interpunctella TaxID=58824 RepID=UPI0023674394|nr:chorion class B protein PC401-like [Plodia interpunctella]
MVSKISIAFFAQALLIQLAFAQYNIINSGANGYGWADELGLGGAYGFAGSGLGLASGLGVVSVPAAGVEVVGAGLGGNLGGLGWNGGLGVANGLGLVSVPGVEVGGAGLANLGLGLGSGLNLDAGFGLAGVGLGAGQNLGLGNAVVASPAFLNLGSLSVGGVFPVTSVGPIAPSTITVVSDNVIEGVVFVSGQLPFLSAVGIEGAIASGGAGAASCGCGTGNVGIVSENAAGGLGALGGLAGLGGLGYLY